MPDETPHEEVVLTPLDLRVRSGIAILFLLGYFTYLYMVTYWPAKLPGDTLGMVLGQLGNLIALVFGFYFGLSVGTALGKKGTSSSVVVTSPTDNKMATTVTTGPTDPDKP